MQNERKNNVLATMIENLGDYRASVLVTTPAGTMSIMAYVGECLAQAQEGGPGKRYMLHMQLGQGYTKLAPGETEVFNGTFILIESPDDDLDCDDFDPAA